MAAVPPAHSPSAQAYLLPDNPYEPVPPAGQIIEIKVPAADLARCKATVEAVLSPPIAAPAQIEPASQQITPVEGPVVRCVVQGVALGNEQGQ